MGAAPRNARRMAFAVLIHVVSLATLALWSRRAGQTFGITYFAIAIGPAIPVVAAVWFAARLLREQGDVYQLKAALEAMLWAAGVTFGIATAWGFLEEASKAPRVPSYFAFTVYCIVAGAVRTARHLVGGAALGSEPSVCGDGR